MPRKEVFPSGHILEKPYITSDRLIINLVKKHLINENIYFTCPITVKRYTILKNIKNLKVNNIEVLKVTFK